MRVLLTSEAKFERTVDGTIWASTPNGCSMWSQHLEVFSAVLVLARVADVREPSSGCVQASGDGISFCPLSPYSGFGGLIRNGQRVHAVVSRAVRACPAIIVRSPSPVAYLAARLAQFRRHPFGAHIVGDPDQVFSAGAFRHPLRIPLRHAAAAAQRQVARDASVVMFVTMNVLQRKYPSNGRVFSGSDVALDDSAFIPERPLRRPEDHALTLITVASLDQPYKGIAVLLDAVGQLRRSGRLVKLLVVGDGALMGELQAQAQSLGISSNVEFLGQLDREGVQGALDRADVFVLPSLTEGLPRALLEAMARGLPALATTVGGIPELLPAECLVPPRNAGALARRLREIMATPTTLRAMAQRNQEVARAYHDRVQTPIRRAFLLAVRDVSSGGHCEAACA
jgi:glycosyltransferase involved in cell wall biosynthesis